MSTTPVVPDHIARAAVLPDSYLDVPGTVYPAYRWLRENLPVGRAELPGYDPVWLVTRYADIQTVERRTDAFTVTKDNIILNEQSGDAFMAALTGGVRAIDAITYMDPPEHSKVRGVAGPWFTPRHIATLRTASPRSRSPRSTACSRSPARSTWPRSCRSSPST